MSTNPPSVPRPAPRRVRPNRRRPLPVILAEARSPAPLRPQTGCLQRWLDLNA